MAIKYGFIGCGNMGGALIKGAAKAVNPQDIYITDKDKEKAISLSKETATSFENIEKIAKECKYIFLGVKPQVMENMLLEIKDILKERTDKFILITMAAGLTIDTIKSYSLDCPIIRIMPNLPVSAQEGMIVYSYKDVRDEEIQEFLNLMKCVGKLEHIDEELIDAACSLSGCGPAFVFMYIKALAKGGEECGLSKELSLLLAKQTVLGSAKLTQESNLDLETLTDNVCSKGGSTIEGVNSLKSNNLEKIVIEAVKASYKRNLELKENK